MVVKLENVSNLYADVYPTCAKLRGRENMECFGPECGKKLKQRPKFLPALVEDDAEPLEDFEEKPRRRPYIPQREIRRQPSVSPKRERLQRQMLPSLSEDEEP